jgi:hypothetical protein
MKVKAVEGYRVPNIEHMAAGILSMLPPGEVVEVPACPDYINELRKGTALLPACPVSAAYAPVPVAAPVAGKKADK